MIALHSKIYVKKISSSPVSTSVNLREFSSEEAEPKWALIRTREGTQGRLAGVREAPRSAVNS